MKSPEQRFLRLPEILKGGAIGEALSVLSDGLSPALLIEKCSPEGILHFALPSIDLVDPDCGNSVLAMATEEGLRAASNAPDPFNLDIRKSIHEAQRAWARREKTRGGEYDVSLVRTLLSDDPIGTTTNVEIGGGNSLLRIAPIGLMFFYDPGRAFAIGVEATALADTDQTTCISCGALAMIIAHAASGQLLRAAVRKTRFFLGPIDWNEEVLDMLGQCVTDERFCGGRRSNRQSASYALGIALSAVLNSDSFPAALSHALQSRPDQDALVLTGQLAAMIYGRDAIPEHWRSLTSSVPETATPKLGERSEPAPTYAAATVGGKSATAGARSGTPNRPC